MTAETRIKGTWWSPESPDKKLPGELTYSSTGGAQLDLYDYFFDTPDDSALRRQFTDWRITANGKPATLFKCHTRNLSMHLPGAKSARISTCFGVLGGHFSAPSEMKFCEMICELTNLADWAARSGIRVQLDQSAHTTTFTFRVPEDVSLGECNGVRVRLVFSGNVSHEQHGYRLREDCKLVVESDELVSCEVFDELVGKLQHFFAIGIGRAVYRTSTIAHIDQPKFMVETTPVYEDFEFIRKIDLPVDAGELLLAMQMPFSLAALEPQPALILAAYLDKHARLDPVYDLYFSTLYNRDMPTRQRFLSLAHALEAYHRAFIGGKYVTDEDYERDIKPLFLRAIPEELEPNFKVSLRNKLKYLHEFSLRKQVQDVCARFENLLSKLCGDPKSFSNRVSDTRNRLTHPDANAPCEMDWKELWLLSEQVALVLSLCLLHELGFAVERIRVMLNNNRHARAIFLNR